MSDVLQGLIRKASDEIREKMSAILKEQSELQKACSHPNVTKDHKSNAGNYDPSSDAYWTDFRCPDCHKFWTEEGSR
ncbi:MAG: hypothetical protein EPO10_28835 [Reyranella sp.]|uniref:hypothetical protein n=1 Tax=Reyranella sp. TaxID=1929291 RepID=UPI00121EE084|nr:hypothetical protein [Reyranella sp.]TAJ97139.1 MAG: hypothetical protein EPO41_03870 [Reyranella sp.]TBR22043.1 MAG: hypothetical protein EPO10_28835 [Reyranella sp.]